MDINSE
jgi:hypothetical protein